jgi:hypothetical protein
MEDKKGVKCEHSPSAEGSLLADDAKTPPPVPSGSTPPPGSPSDVSSHRRCSSVFEQGSASGVTPVSGPSLLVVDTSRDEEFARKLFGNLNHDIIGPAGDGKIIIIDDRYRPHDSSCFTTIAPVGARIANSDDQGFEQEADGGNDSGRSTGKP